MDPRVGRNGETEIVWKCLVDRCAGEESHAAPEGEAAQRADSLSSEPILSGVPWEGVEEVRRRERGALRPSQSGAPWESLLCRPS